MKKFPVYLTEDQIDIIRIALSHSQDVFDSIIQNEKDKRFTSYWMDEKESVIKTQEVIENTQKTLFNY